jgi:hypothetical protein
MQVNDYLDAVLQVIRTNQRPEGLKAATLGQLIIRAVPNERWKSLGFPTLKSVLLQLQNRGSVRLNPDSQGALAVWYLETPPATPPTLQAPGPGTQRYNPLRKDFWLSFASAQPLGRRFANRTDGTVRMGLEERPAPADQWTEITPVPDAEQKAWARQFLSDQSLGENHHLQSALEHPNWFTEFPRALRTIDTALSFNWNRMRSERISAAVRRWCEEHKIDPELAFEQHGRGKRPESPVTVQNDTPRSLILGAIQRMTTDELLQLAIPAKYLIRELGL